MEKAKRLRKKNQKGKVQEFRKQTIMASGNHFINVFRKLLQETGAKREDMFLYMQRVYHAIFFFGHINVPQIKPSEFIATTSWDEFERIFQKPLQEYNTHLPSQTPYSILLEYITKIYDDKHDFIMKELEKRNKELLIDFIDERKQLSTKGFALPAAVISHSCIKDPCRTNTLRTAYGSSIAYKGTEARRIMIGISALFVWDKVISYEVSCGESGHGMKFPNNVSCTSYKFVIKSQKFETIAPCAKCNQMYIVNFDPMHVNTNTEEPWMYGNCAETESLSNLLCYNKIVRDNVTTFDNNKETMSREDINNRFSAEHEGKLREEVRNLLENQDFNVTQHGLVLFTPAEYAPR